MCSSLEISPPETLSIPALTFRIACEIETIILWTSQIGDINGVIGIRDYWKVLHDGNRRALRLFMLTIWIEICKRSGVASTYDNFWTSPRQWLSESQRSVSSIHRIREHQCGRMKICLLVKYLAVLPFCVVEAGHMFCRRQGNSCHLTHIKATIPS